MRGRKIVKKSDRNKTFSFSLQTNNVLIISNVYLDPLSKILIQYVYFVLGTPYDFSVYHILFENLTRHVTFFETIMVSVVLSRL